MAASRSLSLSLVYRLWEKRNDNWTIYRCMNRSIRRKWRKGNTTDIYKLIRDIYVIHTKVGESEWSIAFHLCTLRSGNHFHGKYLSFLQMACNSPMNIAKCACTTNTSTAWAYIQLTIKWANVNEIHPISKLSIFFSVIARISTDFSSHFFQIRHFER